MPSTRARRIGTFRGVTAPGQAVETATALAQALDRNDFTSAARWIAPDCVYEVRGERVLGAAAILASYAESAKWAQRQFDEVRYESDVGLPDGDTVPVLYTDNLQKAGGRWHRHRCRQHLTIAPSGLVTRIVHEDLPGEVEALEAYFAACGISR